MNQFSMTLTALAIALTALLPGLSDSEAARGRKAAKRVKIIKRGLVKKAHGWGCSKVLARKGVRRISLRKTPKHVGNCSRAGAFKRGSGGAVLKKGKGLTRAEIRPVKVLMHKPHKVLKNILRKLHLRRRPPSGMKSY